MNQFLEKTSPIDLSKVEIVEVNIEKDSQPTITGWAIFSNDRRSIFVPDLLASSKYRFISVETFLAGCRTGEDMYDIIENDLSDKLKPRYIFPLYSDAYKIVIEHKLPLDLESLKEKTMEMIILDIDQELG